MKNKLSDLSTHVFEQIEKLLDDDVCKDKEATEAEIAKSGAIIGLANTVIGIGNLQLNAFRMAEQNGWRKKELPVLLGGKDEEVDFGN